MFLDVNGERFRILKQEPDGVWRISYDEPSPPCFVLQEEINIYCRVPIPEGCTHEQTEKEMTDAERVRLAMIQPLLDDENCISDKRLRQQIAAETAEAHGTNSRGILRLYYQYLATGIIIKKKSRRQSSNGYEDIYKWAINHFYYSAKRPSLRDAYDLMLHQCFVTPNGHLKEQRSTCSSFRHFFYDNQYHQRSQKIIARDGLSNYQRTARPLLGSAMNWKERIGAYQMSQEMVEQDTAPTAAGLWRYYANVGKSGLMEINGDEVYYMSLPRKTGKLTRKGITHNHFTYINRDFMGAEQGQRYIGQKVSFAYDEQNIQKIYMILDGSYIPFELAPQFSIYGGSARTESELYWQDDRQRKKDYKKLEEEGRVDLIKKISSTKDEAQPEQKEDLDGESIKQNRTKERDRRK